MGDDEEEDSKEDECALSTGKAGSTGATRELSMGSEGQPPFGSEMMTGMALRLGTELEVEGFSTGGECCGCAF